MKKISLLSIFLLFVVGIFGQNLVLAKNKTGLHSSLSDFDSNIQTVATKKFKIRIDKIGADNYRYASWSANKTQAHKPDIILKNGKVVLDTNNNRYYDFKNRKFTYRLHVYFANHNENEIGKLQVFERDELLVEQKIIKNIDPLPIILTTTTNSPFPNGYIERDSCPGEYCSYKKWLSEANQKVYAKKDLNSAVVGNIKKCQMVEIVTGDVHLTPIRVVVDTDNSYLERFKKGDVIWLLGHVSEGVFNAMKNGRLTQIDILEASKNYSALMDKHFKTKTWWIKAKLDNGITGWLIKNDDNFRGSYIDQSEVCGKQKNK